jgi:hypothetical protein
MTPLMQTLDYRPQGRSPGFAPACVRESVSHGGPRDLGDGREANPRNASGCDADPHGIAGGWGSPLTASPVLEVSLETALEVVEGCLHGSFASRQKVRALLMGMAALARQGAAVALRLAMELAWIKRQDISDLGYSSFAAYCRERVDWRGSWLRDLIRLVESPLDLVKEAARRQLIPLRIAVRAPREVQPEGQEQWLADQVLGAPSPELPHEPRFLEYVEGKDAQVVRQARHLARVCLGRAVSARQVDDYILRCWCDRVPAEQILAEARERPPKPEWESELSWDWCARGGTADALVGQWPEPASLEEAVRRVEALQAVRRGRTRVLARAWATADYECLWLQLGFDSGREFAREVLWWSPSTAQRYRRLGWTLEWYPQIDEAIRTGFDLERAELLGRVVEDFNVKQWLALARRVGRLELRQAVDDATNEGRSWPTLRRYAQAIAEADAWRAEQARGGEAGGGPSGDGARADTCAKGAEGRASSAGDVLGVASSAGGVHGDVAGGAASSAGGGLFVAIPHAEPGQVRAPLRVPTGLVEASRWFVEEVKLPPQRGFGQVKERDGYRCSNPECGRLSLRNEGHHLVMRSEGGPDEEENGTTVCRVCHLRGIHAGKIVVERVVVGGADALLWTYSDGRRVLVFRTLPDGNGGVRR